jgi:large repetitive protein
MTQLIRPRKIIIALGVMTAAVCSAISVIAQTTTNPPGLVSLWAAEGNASDSTAMNPGVLRGGITFAEGNFGQAFAFDGSGGYLEVPDHPSLQLLQESTLLAWVYLDELPSQTGRNLYIAGRSQNGNDFDLEVESDNRVRFYPCGGVGGGGYPGSTTIVQTGVWYHVAATYKANARMELFINGVNEISIPINCVLGGNPSPFTIGLSPVWGRPFHGRIDQVRLYNRALSAAEIAALYVTEPGALPNVPLTIRVSQVELCWETFIGVAYQLQYSSVLTTNRWVPFSTNFFTGTGGVFCTNDAVLPGQPQKFYRLIVTNAPTTF